MPHTIDVYLFHQIGAGCYIGSNSITLNYADLLVLFHFKIKGSEIMIKQYIHTYHTSVVCEIIFFPNEF